MHHRHTAKLEQVDLLVVFVEILRLDLEHIIVPKNVLPPAVLMRLRLAEEFDEFRLANDRPEILRPSDNVLAEGGSLVLVRTPNARSEERVVIGRDGQVVCCPNAFAAAPRGAHAEIPLVGCLVGREAHIAVYPVLYRQHSRRSTGTTHDHVFRKEDRDFRVGLVQSDLQLADERLPFLSGQLRCESQKLYHLFCLSESWLVCSEPVPIVPLWYL